MQTRREMLSTVKKAAPTATVIPATVNHRLNKKDRKLDELAPQEKMICALRKALVKLSDGSDGCRYFIANNQVMLISAPTASSVKPGQARTYTAKGRCRLGVCHPEGHASSRVIEFSITFRDVMDDRGLADVEYIDPTTIDELPRGTPLTVV
jgi:hypothetical protein